MSFVEDFRENIKFANESLKFLSQPILDPPKKKSLVGWFFYYWPIWFNLIFTLGYVVLLCTERPRLQVIVNQAWALACYTQLLAKMFNRMACEQELKDILKWCEQKYTDKSLPKFQKVADKVFASTNKYIRLCLQVNSLSLKCCLTWFLVQPLFIGDRQPSIQISYHGQEYFPMHVFLAIYVVQAIQSVSVVQVANGYDGVFIQVVMQLRYQYKIMKDTLAFLGDCKTSSEAEQRECLVHVLKTHNSCLQATKLFQRYYRAYGLVQIFTNLLANCFILYTLQTVGYDLLSVNVLLCSTVQVFVACVFSQFLQNEAEAFSDALYTDVDWVNMSLKNRKILLLLMAGSLRPVSIRAGETYELNLPLFASIMKGGITLCAVLKAME